MEFVNGIKFVTYMELRDHLNACITARKLYQNPQIATESPRYSALQIGTDWADARSKYFLATGNKVEEGVHFIKGEDGAHLLSLEGVKLIHQYANFDGHSEPMLDEGAELLFQ